ncbi:MAG TPA: D-alanyl-D-alanine carboxypeptidase/D-alanyl-D-alanine-endopeptidase [Solirubrobacter sp.]|nr:D-alanyl-D-alanine carboxypeptidase/D-alanyl-D-alanine-endopeptidase [Solirubrobacter sp.]
MRRWSATLGVALLLTVPGAAYAADGDAGDALRRTLDVELANPQVNASVGVYVWDAASRQELYAFHPAISRTPASNTKLFTSAAALDAYGVGGRLTTRVVAAAPAGPGGVIDGDLYLVGGGDPTFGTAATIASRYAGVGAKVEDLLDALVAAGVTSVTGRVVGDASRFDGDVGPSNGESALTFDRGVRSQGPALWAAQQFTTLLRARGIAVAGTAATGTAPAGATELAAVQSPTIGELLPLMNKPSDNFFAEMLIRNVAAAKGLLGTTVNGAQQSEALARSLGIEIDQVDGSGLSAGNEMTPTGIVRLLDVMRSRSGFDAFYGSLPVAGVDGTLAARMVSSPATGACHAKTGTLGSTTSSLSGYCQRDGGHLVLFSILMNRTSELPPAQAAQDRMADAIAAYSAATAGEAVDTVSESSPAGGDVPATLSLTLGAPASFGSFVPGVAGTYEASTTANVVSTAADATLTVVDPAGTGHLVNGAVALPQALEVRAGDGAFAPVGGAPTPLVQLDGPVSNDAAIIGFRQAIGADTPLRTGRYEKALRFTLSTTTP